MKRRDLIAAGGLVITAPFVLAATRTEERSFARLISAMNQVSPINKLPRDSRREVRGNELPGWVSTQEPVRWYIPPEVTIMMRPSREVLKTMDVSKILDSLVRTEQNLIDNSMRLAKDVEDRHYNIYATIRNGGWEVTEETEIDVAFSKKVSVLATWHDCVFKPYVMSS